MAAIGARVDLDALYCAHAGWLRAWLSRHTRCGYRAADLAQDAFCRLLEHKPDIPLHNPRGYLATVARRLLIDDIRHREIERSVLEAFAIHQPGIETITPDRVAEAMELLHAVAKILEGLPEEARTAFLLRRIDGLEQKDIAHRLGISLSTVKRHIASAYARCYLVAHAD